jgi:hypothetical protein
VLQTCGGADRVEGVPHVWNSEENDPSGSDHTQPASKSPNGVFAVLQNVGRNYEVLRPGTDGCKRFGVIHDTDVNESLPGKFRVVETQLGVWQSINVSRVGARR